jgi:hypothetical protein
MVEVKSCSVKLLLQGKFNEPDSFAPEVALAGRVALQAL